MEQDNYERSVKRANAAKIHTRVLDDGTVKDFCWRTWRKVGRKQWYWFVELEPELALTRKLFVELKNRMSALLPAIAFLNAPLLAQQKKEAQKAKFSL